jgi:hypothetical protein
MAPCDPYTVGMPDTHRDRAGNIALLIDADNASADNLDAVLNVLAELGKVNIRRAYGNWQKPALKGWSAMVHKRAIEPQQQFDLTKGKSSTDMKMIIDAMDLLYGGPRRRLRDHVERQRLLGLEIALEPFDVAVALEGEDVGGEAVEEPAVVADDHAQPAKSPAPPPARAASRRRGRWSARRAAGRCRPDFSILARCTRLRSPPESCPTFFCWSAPLKLNATHRRGCSSRACRAFMMSSPPEISSQTFFVGSSASRLWST